MLHNCAAYFLFSSICDTLVQIEHEGVFPEAAGLVIAVRLDTFCTVRLRNAEPPPPEPEVPVIVAMTAEGITMKIRSWIAAFLKLFVK